MDRTDLYLKTAFCCMACDGNIAAEEVDLINKLPLFSSVDYCEKINGYVEQLNNDASRFLRQYLDEVKSANLSEEEECQLVSIAVKTIEADRVIEYNEIAFFKKIRSRLKTSDEMLLKVIPENPAVADQISPEDYLLPDITLVDDLSLWSSDHFIIATDLLSRLNPPSHD